MKVRPRLQIQLQIIHVQAEQCQAQAAFACLKKCLKLIAKFWDEHEAMEQPTGVCLARLGSLAMANGTFGVSNFQGMVKMSAMACCCCCCGVSGQAKIN